MKKFVYSNLWLCLCAMPASAIMPMAAHANSITTSLQVTKVTCVSIVAATCSEFTGEEQALQHLAQSYGDSGYTPSRRGTQTNYPATQSGAGYNGSAYDSSTYNSSYNNQPGYNGQPGYNSQPGYNYQPGYNPSTYNPAYGRETKDQRRARKQQERTENIQQGVDALNTVKGLLNVP